MSSIIKNPRNGCALHGALQTVQEIRGVVPVVHANAGCGVINYLANSKSSGGNSKFSGYSIPGTSAQERHVIFGGASRLREQIKNTIKVVDGDNFVVATPPRSQLVSVQTPQGFRREILLKAYAQAEAEKFLGTDDASLVERLGERVKVVTSNYDNIKITTPEDLSVAETFLRGEIK